MQPLTFVKPIADLQHDCIINWKKNAVNFQHTDFLRLVEENHAFNYQLWHAEDRARREDKGHTFVYQAKREIDDCNQQRNNRMEAIDGWLFQQLQPSTDLTCPIHSETPGMMIDRLSILALKAYHMKVQTERTEVDENHRQLCHNKLLIIVQQQTQLQNCLQQLIDEINKKTRTYKIYYQFKMYNDPSINPELYQYFHQHQ